MQALRPFGLWLIGLAIGLSGAFAGRTNAEIPPLDAAPAAQVETATFSLG